MADLCADVPYRLRPKDNKNYWRDVPLSAPARTIVLLCCFLIATLSWKFIETPVRRRTLLPDRPRLLAVSGAAMLFMLAAGLGIYWSNGMRFRWPAQVVRYIDGEVDVRFEGDVKLSSAQKEDFVKLGPEDDRLPIECIIWGDSHAMAILPVIDALCRERGIRAVAAARYAQMPLLNYDAMEGRWLRAHPQEVAPYATAVLNAVRKHNIPKVILVAAWNHYDVNANPLTGKVFVERVAETITAIQQAGAKVWIMMQVPQYNKEVPLLLARATVLREDPTRLGMPISEYRKRNGYIASVFDQLAHRGVTILDPASYLADEGGLCRMERGGRALYRDSTHLSAYGALQLRELFEPIFPSPP